MKPMTAHRIRQLRLDVRLESAGADGLQHGKALQQRIGAFCQRELEHALAPGLDEAAPGESLVRIRKIELDLGRIAIDALDTQLGERLRRALAEQLGRLGLPLRHVPAMAPANPDTHQATSLHEAVQLLAPEQRQFETLTALLQGRADRYSAQVAWETLLRQLAQQRPSELASLLRRELRDAHARRRLLRGLSATGRRHLWRWLAAPTGIARCRAGLLAALRRGAEASRALMLQLDDAALAQWLAQPEQVDTAAFVRGTLQRLALAQEQPYAVLLQTAIAGAEHSSPLRAVLNSLPQGALNGRANDPALDMLAGWLTGTVSAIQSMLAQLMLRSPQAVLALCREWPERAAARLAELPQDLQNKLWAAFSALPEVSGEAIRHNDSDEPQARWRRLLQADDAIVDSSAPARLRRWLYYGIWQPEEGIPFEAWLSSLPDALLLPALHVAGPAAAQRILHVPAAWRQRVLLLLAGPMAPALTTLQGRLRPAAARLQIDGETFARHTEQVLLAALLSGQAASPQLNETLAEALALQFLCDYREVRAAIDGEPPAPDPAPTPALHTQLRQWWEQGIFTGDEVPVFATARQALRELDLTRPRPLPPPAAAAGAARETRYAVLLDLLKHAADEQGAPAPPPATVMPAQVSPMPYRYRVPRATPAAGDDPPQFVALTALQRLLRYGRPLAGAELVALFAVGAQLPAWSAAQRRPWRKLLLNAAGQALERGRLSTQLPPALLARLLPLWLPAPATAELECLLAALATGLPAAERRRAMRLAWDALLDSLYRQRGQRWSAARFAQVFAARCDALLGLKPLRLLAGLDQALAHAGASHAAKARQSVAAALRAAVADTLPKKAAPALPKPRESNEAVLPTGEPLYVGNAGLVLLWPFLTRYFEMLGLVADGSFVDETARSRAVYLLQFLASGRHDAPEHELLLNKLLCGMPASGSPEFVDAPDEPAKRNAHSLLHAVTQRWEKLKNTSVQGLRETFLLREGRLLRHEDKTTLTVSHKAYDMLLDSLPWSYSIVKLPWMPAALFVQWR